jgi:AGCS family alanine or glycine:cation symporter
MFISVALALFVFTSILYNYYLGENSLRFILGENRKALIGYRALVLALILWGAVENLSTVFAFADITMTLLAFVNLIALALLFKVGMRILRDYDDQRKAGIKTPVFDSSKFADLDIDLKAWPANPSAPAPTTQPESQPHGAAQTQR